MAEEELLDVLDEQMKVVGTASRERVHAEGWWHQTFHCWVVTHGERGEWSIVFQLRHPDKDTYPCKLDTSCAGHLLAGETPADGIRELEEELGLRVAPNELIYCGIARDETVVSATITDREFNHVYLYPCDRKLSSFEVQKAEVSGLFRFNLTEIQALLHGEREGITAVESMVLESAPPGSEDPQKIWTLQDFTPNNEPYYRLLFDTLRRLEKTEGEGAE